MVEGNSQIGVYSLSNAYYLYYDINRVFTEINELYYVTFNSTEVSVGSKMVVEPGIHWASDKNKETFNHLLPKIKSLHKNMYALVEAISKDKEGEFKKNELEASIPHFKEFRLLNNQFKHFSETGVKIDVVSINLISDKLTIMDVNCQFKYPSGDLDLISWGKFIITFLLVLEQYAVIARGK